VEKTPPTQLSRLADIPTIHRTLSQLLETLSLSEQHRKKLHERGLSDGQIAQGGYRSAPLQALCLPLTEKLIAMGCAVQGVPGFYLDKNGKWMVKFHRGAAGILIPIRGIDGLLRGAQIRLDTPIKDTGKTDKKGAKYIWLSSSNQHMGVNSGSPVHFVGDPYARAVYVTEGALKANIAHCLMNRSFAATAGANNLSGLDPLFALLVSNGVKLIVEAFDMDKSHNEMVAKGAARVRAMALRYGMECRSLTWNPSYKGIDDWQFALR
jgi:hypothetical protein